MKRSECTSETLKAIGFETIPHEAWDYVTPLKNVAYYLREEGFDCKVELDTETEYQRTSFDWTSAHEATKVIYYHFEYLYIRPHGTAKWNKVARREVETYHYTVNKNRD